MHELFAPLPRLGQHYLPNSTLGHLSMRLLTSKDNVAPIVLKQQNDLLAANTLACGHLPGATCQRFLDKAFLWPQPTIQSDFAYPHALTSNGGESLLDSSSVSRIADYFASYPVPVSGFGELGKRLQILKTLIQHAETVEDEEKRAGLSTLVDSIAKSLAPYLTVTSRRPGRPLQELRNHVVEGSKGIVIPTGTSGFRYACHLILNLRSVLRSQLPIEIAYAGDADLPAHYRDFIGAIAEDITFQDVTKIFNDEGLALHENGWAVKPFATLGSCFEQLVLVDADAVFLQDPVSLLDDHPAYTDTGVLLFHDRLLWKGGFPERHQCWEQELKHTHLSSTTKNSKVFAEGYAGEADSGVVVLNKPRLDVLIGLLHIGWQNSKAVQDAFTYRLCYGDKESWWFGFELVGTPYSMERHYASMLGHVKLGGDNRAEQRVCSFTIAHLDDLDRLLWLNGSLLKNKHVNATEFDVPTEYMLDGKWEKGNTKQDMSCMSASTVRHVP